MPAASFAIIALLLLQPRVEHRQEAGEQEQQPATSQVPPSDGAPDQTPPVFYETTTVSAQPVSSAAGAVTVLAPSALEAAAARTASDGLHEVVGLNVLSSGGRAGVSNAWIRGGDSNFTLVLLDGIPLNDPTELQGGAVNLEELPANDIERVEVVRGPLTSFYGANALSGVVQLFLPRGGPGPFRAAGALEGGNAELRRAFGRVSGAAGRDDYAAGASWDQEAHRVGEDRFRQLDLWSTADLALGESSALALSGRFDDGRTADYPDASGGPGYGTGLLRETKHQDLDAAARLDLGDSVERRQRVLFTLARRDLDRTSPAVPPEVPASQEHTLFTRLGVDWQAPLVRTSETRIDAGLSGAGEWGDNASVLELPPDLGGNVPGDYAKRRLTCGAFGGARHDQGSLLYEAALRLDLVSGDDLQANPHLGLVWHPGDGATRLRASFGRASKMPSFFALASPPALGGNPDLAPEHVWGGEGGVERSFSRARLELGATYFRDEYNNLIDFDFDTFQLVNRARVRSQGVELTARWRPHVTVSVEGEATYLDLRSLTGGALLQTPRWTGGGRLTWQPIPEISLRVQSRATSGYLDRQYPAPDRDSVEGYGLLGFAGSWRMRAGLTLRARLDNLTDESYETLIGFPGPSRSFWLGIGWARP
jgi:vitamin B12 transporter